MSQVIVVRKPEKRTKIVLPLKDFLKYTKVNYKEDLWDSLYFSFERYGVKELVDNLPKSHAPITEEILEDNDVLYSCVNRAFNRAQEQALLDDAYEQQNNGLENFCSSLCDMLKDVAGKDVAKSITIDWKEDTVTLDLYMNNTIEALVEIINGEGMFYFQTVSEFVCSHDGKYAPKRTIENHLHYLLDYDLINRIYGIRSRDIFSWESRGGCLDEKIYGEMIDEELASEKVEVKKEVALVQ